MKKFLTSLIIIFLSTQLLGQTFPEGITYQAQVRGTTGAIISNQTIDLEFNIRQSSMTGTIVWQERHTVTTNGLGHFEIKIGEGNNTGNGTISSFNQIQWGDSNYFVEMLIDETNSGTFTSIHSQQFMTVPFAYHSKSSDQEYKLSELLDVDTTGIQTGDILVWNGSMWVAQNENITNCPDTLNFSYLSDSSNFSDTAGYALNYVDANLVDSSNYSYYSDTANFAFQSYQSVYSDSANFSDTANIALYSLGNWSLDGDNINGQNYFLGTTDSMDLMFKTNNTERMVVKANGTIGFGINNPQTDFHVANNNGVLFSGEYGIGNIPTEGPGTRMMWYPAKSAFRAGTVTSTYWNDYLIGHYSFSSGYNTRASGLYSVSFGFNSNASGEGAFAVGQAATASGDYSFAAGHNPQANADHSIALGRGAIVNNISGIAIGYHPTADGEYAMSLGNYTYAYGDHSVAMGYHSQAMHEGSFVYGDKSTEAYLQTTSANQFMVRANGGYVFYTSADLSTGVVLAPGAGSWSILSDSTKKQNITSISPIRYVNKLDSIDVYSWNYKSQNKEIKHIGPMAQDFYATFDIGADSTMINSGDFDGINLLLLKGLNEKLDLIEDQKEKISELEKELMLLEEKRLQMQKKLEAIENKLDNK